jgi:hypothetical protein
MTDSQPIAEQPTPSVPAVLTKEFTSLPREAKMLTIAAVILGAVIYYGMPAIIAEYKAALKQVTETYERDQDRDAEAQKSKDRLIEAMVRGTAPRSVGYLPDGSEDLTPPN